MSNETNNFPSIILTTQDLEPLGFYNQDGIYDGIAYRVVIYALNAMNVNYEIRVLPWARAQYEVQNGTAQGFFAGSKNPERDSFGVMSEIIADQNWIWYQLKENYMDPQEPNFKSQKTVGSYIGANMLDWLEEEGYIISAKPKDTEALFTMLLTGRVDAILANNLVAAEIVKRDNLENLLTTRIERSMPLGAYFSKQFVKENPRFLPTFNKHVLDYFAVDSPNLYPN